MFKGPKMSHYFRHKAEINATKFPHIFHGIVGTTCTHQRGVTVSLYNVSLFSSILSIFIPFTQNVAYLHIYFT